MLTVSSPSFQYPQCHFLPVVEDFRDVLAVGQECVSCVWLIPLSTMSLKYNVLSGFETGSSYIPQAGLNRSCLSLGDRKTGELLTLSSTGTTDTLSSPHSHLHVLLAFPF